MLKYNDHHKIMGNFLGLTEKKDEGKEHKFNRLLGEPLTQHAYYYIRGREEI